MPEEGYLILPQRPRILKTDANASDEHGVVTIAHKHGFDSDMIRSLTEEGTSEEQAIQLGQLASWLGSKDPDSYRVFRQDYMVE